MPDETIVLPRSGVVLTKERVTLADYLDVVQWRTQIGVLGLWMSDGLSEGTWDVVCGDESATKDSLAEALAWMDENVLALRAALLPADARERVARALWKNTSRAGIEYELHPEWCEWETSREGDKDWFFAQADAVLAALVSP